VAAAAEEAAAAGDRHVKRDTILHPQLTSKVRTLNQPGYGYRRPDDNSVIPNVIFVLLVANGLVFVLQRFQWELLLQYFALWPIHTPPGWPSFFPWQLVSYAFLHDPNGLAHIFFNMFGLWMFGRDLERLMGPQRFLIYYMTCVIGAGIIQLIVVEFQGEVYPTLGASGGLFGILLAYGMAFPNRTVMLLFPPIPMKAKVFVIVYGVLELFLGVSGYAPGVAHFAHLGGMLFGFLLLRHWSRRRS
jgi:membrane associated rhomboid family serine protease